MIQSLTTACSTVTYSYLRWSLPIRFQTRKQLPTGLFSEVNVQKIPGVRAHVGLESTALVCPCRLYQSVQDPLHHWNPVHLRPAVLRPCGNHRSLATSHVSKRWALPLDLFIRLAMVSLTCEWKAERLVFSRGLSGISQMVDGSH